ncbi:NADPH-dependent FMN reductase [Streptococcus pneumoniae]|nr:NADPH-dependent FMN reductase [Streptococcus pneumoniae]
MLKLIAIVGTNSKRSTNRQLLQYMQKHFADKAEIELVEIKAIPVFNKPADKQVPAEILEIAAKIKANVLPDEFLLSHSLQAFNPSGDLVDLDVIKKLDAIFDDFRIFVKITEKLRNAQELLRKDAEDFDWENL